MTNVNVDFGNAERVQKFESFGGLDCERVISDGNSAEECVNFRIKADGSLEKRCGYRKYATYPELIRAVWDGYISGTRRCLVLAGRVIYSLDAASGDDIEIGIVDSESGRAEFFLYDGRLYLIDGDALYTLNSAGTSFNKALGYIPLYGENWSPSSKGAVKEQINRLSPYVRVHYKPAFETDNAFYFDFDVESVYKIYADGREVSPSVFRVSTTMPNSGILSMTPLPKEIVFYVKIANFDSLYPSDVRYCKHAAVYGAANYTRVFLTGGREAREVYRSKEVSGTALSRLLAEAPDASRLYFTEDDSFTVGESGGGISAMCPFEDKLIIFTEGETWYVDCDYSSTRPATPLSSVMGCRDADSVALAEDGIFILNSMGIYKMRVSGSSRERFSFEKISGRIERVLEGEIFDVAQIFYCASRKELWMSKCNGISSSVWVYDGAGNWLKFDGFSPSGFESIGGDVGFFSERALYAFEDSRQYDSDALGNSLEIEASWKSKLIDLSVRERPKKLRYAVLCASALGAEVSLELSADSGGREVHSFTGSRGDAEVFSTRAHLGRFRFMSFCINAAGGQRTRIFSVALASGK